MKKLNCLICAIICALTLILPYSKSVSAADAWIDFGNEPANYDYSIMVVGDTQYVVRDDLSNGYNSLDKLYTYIVDNVEEKKVKHVLGLGDITDKNSNDEWELAHSAISKMDGVVPYSVLCGNHDLFYSANWFDDYFGADSAYAKQEGFIEGYSGGTRSTAHEFSAGGLQYLVIALQDGPSASEIAWANEVVAKYPKHNVIVTTHSYLYYDGTTMDSNDDFLPTTGGYNGEEMWQNFIKKHENIVMVFSGHIYNSRDIVISTQKGDHGNTVTQLLINPQAIDNDPLYPDGTGMVATLYFSNNGEIVDVEYYSTVKQKYYNHKNQFQFKVDVNKDVYVDVLAGKGEVDVPSLMLNGSPMNITFNPSEHYYISALTLNGEDILANLINNVYTINETSGKQKFEVSFERVSYNFTVQNDDSKGTLTFYEIEEADKYPYGEPIIIGVRPKQGYKIDKIVFNGEEVQSFAKWMYNVSIEGQDNTFVVHYAVDNGEEIIDSSTTSSIIDSSTSSNSSLGLIIGLSCAGVVVIAFIVVLVLKKSVKK